MLSKENRLRKRKDFDNIFKNGKAKTGRFIFLKFLKNGLNVSRFGFIVSLKIAKKAVVRNKIKRRLRQVIKNNINKIKPGFDMVITAKPEIVNKNYQEIKNELENELENLFKTL